MSAMPDDEPSPAAPSLHELQSLLQAAVLDGDESVLAWIPDNSRTTRATLFGVYRHAYRGRLVEILGNDYPILKSYVGKESFDDLAVGFINANPSRTPNARWFGAGFPAHLEATAKSCHHTLRAELASIEKALSDAFDCADTTALTLPDIANVPPDSWVRLCFSAHPSVALLTHRTNALEVWRALNQDRKPPRPMTLKNGGSLIVWRHEMKPLVRSISYEEFAIWNEACKGVSFGVLCELLATFDDPDSAATRAASYLQGWLSGGMLSSFVTSPRHEVRRGAGQLEWHQ